MVELHLSAHMNKVQIAMYNLKVFKLRSYGPAAKNTTPRTASFFGLIATVGLANLQGVDMNSPRYLYIVGLAIFNVLSIARPGSYFQNVE